MMHFTSDLSSSFRNLFTCRAARKCVETDSLLPSCGPLHILLTSLSIHQDSSVSNISGEYVPSLLLRKAVANSLKHHPESK